ncbi:MAG: hypothetical protein AB7F36_01860 [Reyranellaceae bacterium]
MHAVIDGDPTEYFRQAERDDNADDKRNRYAKNPDRKGGPVALAIASV